MKVLYLFNRVKEGLIDEIKKGNESDNSFFGMYRLPHFGISAEYLELENFYSKKTANHLRRILKIHFVHLPLFLRFLKYDIVFTSTSFGCLIVKAVFGLSKPKWIMFDFSIAGMVGGGRTFRQKVFSYAVRHGADGIITISKKEEERVKVLFPGLKDRIQFIPLGTDTEFYKPDPFIPEDGGVLTVGKDPFRDYRILFGIFKEINIPLTVITRPEHIDPLLPLSENIRTKSAVPPMELLDEYSHSKIFILSLSTKGGLNEAVGCSTLVEAMAMGKAIIATRTFTMESYITDGENGILVPEGDSGAMKKAILDLWDDEAKRKRLGEAARRFVVKNCDSEIFTASLADYFRKIESS